MFAAPELHPKCSVFAVLSLKKVGLRSFFKGSIYQEGLHWRLWMKQTTTADRNSESFSFLG